MVKTKPLDGAGAAVAEAVPAATPSPVLIEPAGFYNEPDTAALLGMSADTLRRHRKKKSQLAFCRYGRRVFYRGADIIAALEASRRISTSDLVGHAARR